MIRSIIRISTILIMLLAVAVVIIYINHPILLKWIQGTARHIGKPISAIVLTNGRVNSTIKVFGVHYPDRNSEKTEDYLLSLAAFDREGKLKFINIDLKEKWVGRPACTANVCYDFVFGHLFQSETGGFFSPFQDDIKGYGFNPNLEFTGSQIKFNLPPDKLNFDSIRIELKN
jgi:hypothetical protein